MTETRPCNLMVQGYERGACDIRAKQSLHHACEVTLSAGEESRLIRSIHLSRPENYLSIYQSGCNLSCRKCHSWEFSKVAAGTWHTAHQVLKSCIEYERIVTLDEPREKATSFHAGDSCRCCGRCIGGDRPQWCPRKLTPEQILMSPQGYGMVLWSQGLHRHPTIVLSAKEGKA